MPSFLQRAHNAKVAKLQKELDLVKAELKATQDELDLKWRVLICMTDSMASFGRLMGDDGRFVRENFTKGAQRIHEGQKQRDAAFTQLLLSAKGSKLSDDEYLAALRQLPAVGHEIAKQLGLIKPVQED